MREDMVWVQDGTGREQIGRRVNINGKRGTVVDGSDLFITVEWDFPLTGAVKAVRQSRAVAWLKAAARRLLY